MNDKEIINGIQTDTDSGWKELYDAPAKKIRSKIEPLLSGVRDVTFDDVFEEACIILMENVKAGKLDTEGETNLVGYLYTLCKRIALKHARRKKSLTLVEHRTDKDDDKAPKGAVLVWDPGSERSGDTPERVLSEEQQAFNFLGRVLDSIPAQCRSILKLSYWDRMPMKEIAAMSGLKNEDTAKSTKSRCMKKFKDIARAMMDDEEGAEQAIRRTIERRSLHEQLQEFRSDMSRNNTRAYLGAGDRKMTDAQIIEGIRSNSPQAWRALFASVYEVDE